MEYGVKNVLCPIDYVNKIYEIQEINVKFLGISIASERKEKEINIPKEEFGGLKDIPVTWCYFVHK